MRLIFCSVIIILLGNSAFCQYLKLDELLKFQKSSDLSIEKILTSKNWSLDNTQAITETATWGGEDGVIQLKQITYAYNRNAYNSKSEIWLSVIRRDEEDIDEVNDEPKCRIFYQLQNTIDYSKILKRATELGFKESKSWTTEDNEVIKFLDNDKTGITLHIISKKTNDETGKNLNIYKITVISNGDYMLNYSE